MHCFTRRAPGPFRARQSGKLHFVQPRSRQSQHGWRPLQVSSIWRCAESHINALDNRTCNSCSKANTLMQVTRENFQDVLPAVKNSLQACEYYAFDCEMTGLFTNDNQQNYLDELEDRYAQVGLSTMEAAAMGHAFMPRMTSGSGTANNVHYIYRMPKTYALWQSGCSSVILLKRCVAVRSCSRSFGFSMW